MSQKSSFFLVFGFFLLFLDLPAHAQSGSKVSLEFITAETMGGILNGLAKNGVRLDSAKVEAYLEEWLVDVRNQGFFLASVDTAIWFKDKVQVYFKPGPTFKGVEVFPDEGVIAYFSNSDIRLFKSKRKGAIKLKSLESYQKLRKEMLDHAQDSGYPFASVWLDSMVFSGGQVKGLLRLNPGSKITFDTLSVPDGIKMRQSYFAAWLGIKPGTNFSQQKIRQAASQFKQVPYLSLKGKIKPVFDLDKAELQMDVQKKKANRVDGILGFFPNSREDGNKLLLTGQFLLDLYNPFGSGKRIFAQWQQFRPSSQQLDISYTHPHIFRTNLAVLLDLNLLKEDTSFLNFSPSVTFRYDLRTKGKVAFFADLQTTRLLGSTLQAVERLPTQIAQTRFLQYGISYQWRNLDQPFAPRSGWDLEIVGGIGNKQVEPSSSQSDSLFQSIQRRSAQGQFSFRIEKFSPIMKNLVILSGSRAGGVFNNQLFGNDLYRIGGLRSFRGFNENEFFASRYWINTLEPRLYFEEASYLFLFTDQGYVRNGASDNQSGQWLLGVGAGISFETKNGVFSLVYAIGQSDGQAFDPSFSKVHFGFTSRF